jgi:hypothetical protein
MGNKAAKNPAWKPDSAATRCEICDVSFSLLTRRHHCRNCGGLFCNTCTKDRALVPRKRRAATSAAASSPPSSSPSSPSSGAPSSLFERVCGVCFLKLDVSQGGPNASTPLTPANGSSATRNSQGVPVNRRRGSDVGGISRLTVAQPQSQSSSAPPARAL